MRLRIPPQYHSWLTNSTLTHPARTAVAAVASLLAARLLGLPEIYWSAVSTLIVMQSEFGTSWPVAARRFIGTFMGASLGALLVTFAGRGVPVFGAGILVLGLICAALGRAHKALELHLDRAAYRYAGVTLAIIMLIPRPQPAWVIGLHRFFEVSVGIIVALGMTVVWPERSTGMAGMVSSSSSFETHGDAE